MTTEDMTATTVAIVGAGAAGLTLANLLQRCGVSCVVVERQTRAYVEQRQRAGVVEHRAVRMFEEWGLGERLFAGVLPSDTIEIRVDGTGRLFHQHEHARGVRSVSCPQQILVRRLIGTFLDGGGDLRFEAQDVALHDVTGDRPRVTYQDSVGGCHEIQCQFVAGCDGDHGVSRASVPAGALRAYAHDYGMGLLTLLADVPASPYPLFAVSERGFAAQFARGPMASRSYLQCRPDEDVANWPDDRIWDELRLRFGDGDLAVGPVTDKGVVALRGLVHEPMSYGRLFLVGDAAHIINPMGGKGMNLALHDAEVLARGLRAAVQDGDEAPLEAYSETCLRRVWDHQEFSCWMTEMLYDSGDVSVAGPFRRRLARARLERVFASEPAAAAFADLLIGVT
jgi:p-hydroxybenzoate 3-monooxygenase